MLTESAIRQGPVMREPAYQVEPRAIDVGIAFSFQDWMIELFLDDAEARRLLDQIVDAGRKVWGWGGANPH